jgi:hypothetical protein
MYKDLLSLLSSLPRARACSLTLGGSPSNHARSKHVLTMVHVGSAIVRGTPASAHVPLSAVDQEVVYQTERTNVRFRIITDHEKMLQLIRCMESGTPQPATRHIVVLKKNCPPRRNVRRSVFTTCACVRISRGSASFRPWLTSAAGTSAACQAKQCGDTQDAKGTVWRSGGTALRHVWPKLAQRKRCCTKSASLEQKIENSAGHASARAMAQEI